MEDASRLKKGLLPPKRIQDKSITSEKYADGSVQSAAIGTGSVGSSKIAGGAVTNEKIKDDAVTESKVRNSAISVYKIKDGAVVTEKIGTLDQVGVNKADIAAINALFVDILSANNIIATGNIQAQAFYQSGLLLATQSWVSSNFAPK